MKIHYTHISCKINTLSDLYRERQLNYPKFHKMDFLGKIGILAAEDIIKEMKAELTEEELTERTAIVLCGHSGSIDADQRFQSTIKDPEEFFPSPAVFVYTLPNIVTGEIALRHGIHGETAFYLLAERDASQIASILMLPLLDGGVNHVIGGWINADANDCQATFLLINNNNTKIEITETLEQSWNS